MAQIEPDETLGDEGSLITEDVVVRGGLADLVEGGATRGGNLFHSFWEFSVDEGQRVYFANPEGIESILSRVTGDNPSNIFGLLGVDGSADLFLLNPNGIVFGEAATFDIEGSFYGTTGDAVKLGDGVFSAIEPESSRLLQVSPSILLENYLTEDSGDIESRGQLAVLGDLVLAGSGLDLQGQVAAGGDLTLLGSDEVRIRDTEETPFVGFAGGDLLVQGNQQVDIVALSHPDSGLFSYGDMVLRSEAPVAGDAQYWSGGSSFRIEMLSGEPSVLSSPNDPIIRSLGNVTIGDYIGNSLHIIAAGNVFIPGTIRITGADNTGASIQEVVTLSNGETLSIDGSRVATLDIRAGVSPEKIGLPIGLTGTGLFPIGGEIDESPTNANIVIGNAILEQPNGLVFLTNQYFPNEALTPSDIRVLGQSLSIDGTTFPVLGVDARSSDGAGSRVVVDARENFLLDDDASIDTSSTLANAGDISLIAEGEIFLDDDADVDASSTSADAGDINLTAEEIFLNLGAGISAFSDTAKGGDISLSASDIELGGASIIISSGEDGDISLEGDRLIMQPVTSVISDANGTENGGDVVVVMEDSISIIGGNLGTFDRSNSGGKSGDVVIRTGVFDFQAIPPEDIAGRAIVFGSINTDIGDAGIAGDILVEADQVRLSNGAQIRADVVDMGEPSRRAQGGDITIVVSDLLEVTGFVAEDEISKISTNARPGTLGDGGDITISAGRVLVRDGAQIQTGTFSSGQGGNISIEATESILLSDDVGDDRVTGVFAGPEGDFAVGDSGNISIFSDIISIVGLEAFISNEVDSDASGNAGNIEVSSRVLTVRDGGRIVNGTEGNGRGGKLAISSDLVEVVGTGSEGVPSSLSTATFGYAEGGTLTLNIRDLFVLDGAQVVSSSGGIQSGSGGDLTINASGTVKISGVSENGESISTLSTASGFLENIIFTGSIADGGDLSINAENLIISDSALVSSQALGRGINPDFRGQAGNAGNLTVNVSERLDIINGSGLEANTFGPGNAGNLTINAGSLSIQNDSEISTSTIGSRQSEFASGDSGNVDITVAGLTEFSGVGGLGAQSISGGNAADIALETETLIVRDGATISAASLLGGRKAGSIRINANDSLIVTGGRFGQGSKKAHLG